MFACCRVPGKTVCGFSSASSWTGSAPRTDNVDVREFEWYYWRRVAKAFGIF